MRITHQVHSFTQVLPSIIEHIGAMHVILISSTWSSQFARELITCIGVGFKISILEEDSRLVPLSDFPCPEATVGISLLATFFWMLASTPTSRTTANYILLPGVNKDITRLPLGDYTFPIHGLDVTIFSHLSVPLLQLFPSELEVLFNIICHLRDKGKLSYFALFCATVENVPSSEVDASLLLQMFAH